MKTITEIKKHFSNEEIRLLVEIVRGKPEFDVLKEQILDFYSDEYNKVDYETGDDLNSGDEWLRNDLLEKLEFDLEVGGVI